MSRWIHLAHARSGGLLAIPTSRPASSQPARHEPGLTLLLRSRGARRSAGGLRSGPRGARAARFGTIPRTHAATGGMGADESADALPARRGTLFVRPENAGARGSGMAGSEWLRVCILGTKHVRLARRRARSRSVARPH